MKIPLPDPLERSRNVLIAGAGGGFAGLPLCMALQAAGKTVTLANLSFTYLGGTDAEEIVPGMYRVEAGTRASGDYFPEGVLARFLADRNAPQPIYAFDKVGVKPTAAAYQHLVSSLAIDAVVLVDGGTDILMRGDEAGLGTPAEDMVSLAAVAQLDVQTRLVYCLGFGIDTFHGVCHADFLENVAALSREGAFLGSCSLLREMPEVIAYLEAVRYSETHVSSRPSIVNTSIASAIEGHFGDYHRTERTSSSELFISPLMSMYWTFDLAALARRSLYLEDLVDTETIWDVQLVIEAFRSGQTPRIRRIIPH